MGDLAQIEPPLQQLIMHMIQLQPGKVMSRSESRACSRLRRNSNGGSLHCKVAQNVTHILRMRLLKLKSSAHILSSNASCLQACLLCRREAHSAIAPLMHLLTAGKRLSAKAYLEQWGHKLFPGYFGTFLHPFFTALLPMDADERVAAVLAAYPQLLAAMQPSQPGYAESSPGQHLPQHLAA